MRPWDADYTDLTRLRVAIRSSQAVTAAVIPVPAEQQLQQVINLCFINELCDIANSSSYCQICFNLKTHISGVNSYSPSDDATSFNDLGQGGLIAVVGPINSAGRTTNFSFGGSRTPAYTSWGAATQAGVFALTTFQVEISWGHFQGILGAVTGGDVGRVFGPQARNRSAWVLLRAGYGQENYNKEPAAANVAAETSTGFPTIEGLFESLEVEAVGW
jgi:hypothetical protein